MKLLHSLFTVMLLGTLSANGAIYSENFDGLTPGAIAGQDGWAGPGNVVAGTVFGSGSQVLDLGASSTFNTRSISGISGQDIYYGFSIDLSTTTAGVTANETFVRLNGWGTYIALKAENTNSVEVDLGGGGATVMAAPGIVNGSQHRVVGKLSWVGGAFTNHEVFLNPVGPEGANTAIASNTGSDALGTITLEMRNQNVSTNVDDLIFTTSFTEAIPEPGMVGLLGLGCILVIWYRRHIRA